MKTHPLHFHLGAATLFLSLSTASLIAQEVPPSTLDRVWGLATLYQNDQNPVVQKLAFTGRLQADGAIFDSDRGDYQDLLWRRARFGFKLHTFQEFVFHVEADLILNDLDTDELDDTYNRFTDFYLGWSPSEAFTLKIGKQSAPFTLDGATSSKKLATLERSAVATNIWFPTEYFSGIVALGDAAPWSYHLGIYSASGAEEFGQFDSGYFFLSSVGYQLGQIGGFDDSRMRFDYVYNDPDFTGDVATSSLRQAASFVTKWTRNRFQLATDFSWGDGLAAQSDLIGLQILPTYDLSEQWRLALRYSLVSSNGDNGVRLNRYESRIEEGQSNKNHEIFLGLNWYLYGHKLKWQNGVEYTSASDDAQDGGDYDGWGLTSGIRLSW